LPLTNALNLPDTRTGSQRGEVDSRFQIVFPLLLSGDLGLYSRPQARQEHFLWGRGVSQRMLKDVTCDIIQAIFYFCLLGVLYALSVFNL